MNQAARTAGIAEADATVPKAWQGGAPPGLSPTALHNAVAASGSGRSWTGPPRLGPAAAVGRADGDPMAGREQAVRLVAPLFPPPEHAAVPLPCRRKQVARAEPDLGGLCTNRMPG